MLSSDPLFQIGPWRRMIAGSGWLLADQMIRMGLGFVSGAALARLLAPSAYGMFIYATTLASLFLPLVSLGLERVVIRDLARFPEQRPALLGAAGGLRLAGGVLSAALAIGAVLLLGNGDSRIRIMVPLIAVGNVFLASDVVDWAFQADGRFRVPVLARLSGFILSTLAKLALAAAGAPLPWLAVAVLGEMILVGVLLALCARMLDTAPPRVWTVRWDMGFRLVAASWPLLIAEVAIWLFQRLDIVILNRFASESEVGLYAVAVRVAQAGFFLPMLAVKVLSPSVARTPDARAALALTERAMVGLVGIGFGLSVVLSLGGVWLVPLVFGRSYSASSQLLGVLGWTNVFVFMGCCHSLYLVAIDQQRISLKLTWVTAVVSVGLNLLLIPRWRAAGAAAASLGTCLITPVFGVALFKESRPLFAVNLRALAAPVRLAIRLLKRWCSR